MQWNDTTVEPALQWNDNGTTVQPRTTAERTGTSVEPRTTVRSRTIPGWCTTATALCRTSKVVKNDYRTEPGHRTKLGHHSEGHRTKGRGMTVTT